MNMLRKIISNRIFFIFAVFLLLHVVLFDINHAEWGDSYRILRASEYIRQGNYPQDEKRQPVFSLLLAIRPGSVDQVWWGRLEMLLISSALFWGFYELLHQFDLSKNAKSVAMWLMVFNPVLLYWSIRIMADVPFALVVVLIFYFYLKWRHELTAARLLALGLMLGIAILTRFEGYLLAVSLGIGVILNERQVISGSKKALLMAGGAVLIALPWFLYQNPVNSTYFEEPARRVYDLRMVYIYIISSMFLFGFTSACYFYYKDRQRFFSFLKDKTALTVFLGLEMVLILLWPAAIPRLFSPIIPILIIPLAVYIDGYFGSSLRAGKTDLLILGGLLLIFSVSQYVLKLQFLVLIKPLLVLVVLLQIVNIASAYLKKRILFMSSLVVSMLIWSLSTIWLHKDIFKAVVEANKYVVKNLSGTVVYNDVSSVSDWYLDQKSQTDNVTGVYLNMDDRQGRSYDRLSEAGADYVMITNEHNTDMEFSADEVDYLEQVIEFRYTIRGKEFFTKIMEFEQ